MGQINPKIPTNFPLMEDDGGTVIGVHTGAPSGVEMSLANGLVDISTNAIKLSYTNPFSTAVLLTRYTSKEIAAVTHGSANLKVAKVAKATAIGSRTVINTTAVATNLDADTAAEVDLTGNKPLVKPGDTISVEVTDGSSASGTLGVTLFGIQINTDDVANFD